MPWTHLGKKIPLEIYHGVPEGWYETQLIATHAQLKGTFPISSKPATEPGAPSWMPEREEWLQYRKTLYNIADGVKFGDAACVELAVRYIELRHIGSYSGYIRATLARRLKRAPLDAQQINRLCQHFAKLVLKRDFTQEFPNYMKLWVKISSGSELNALYRELEKSVEGTSLKNELVQHMTQQPA